LSEVDAADHLLGPWNDRVRHDTDPELTFVIVPPAVSATRGGFRACINGASTDATDLQISEYRPGSEPIETLAITDCTEGAVTPAVGAVHGSDGAHVVISGVDLDEEVSPCDRRWDVTLDLFRAIAQLAEIVVTPAERDMRGGYAAG
jgi:hypothetical protein